MLRLREFRTKLKGLADLLQYAFLYDEHTMVLKSGALMMGFYFRGHDLASSSKAELESVSAYINNGMMKMGSGWCVHVDAIRMHATDYPAPSRNHFPDPFTRLLDAERREQYQAEGAHYDSVYAMAFTYMPPEEIATKIQMLFIDDGGESKNARRSDVATYSDIIVRYKDAVADIMGALSAAITVRPMDAADLLTYVHRCITGLDHPVRTPAIPMYLDAVLASKDLFAGTKPRIGEKHIRVVSVRGYPAESTPAILDALNQLPMTYRWSTRFMALDPLHAETELVKFRRNWFQKRMGMLGLVKAAFGGQSNWQNNDAVDMANDADAAIAEVQSGLTTYGWYTPAVVVMADEPMQAEENAKEVVRILGNMGFPSQIESINACEAYLGTLPGETFANVRRPLINTFNLADLMPVTSVWSGRDTHPCPLYPKGSPPLMYAVTTGSTPCRVNLHVSDVGHTLIAGPTGSGKTTLLNLLSAQHWRYPDAQMFTFDFKYGAYVTAKAAGCEHYDLAGDGQSPQFYPLGVLETAGDRTWAKEYIEMLCELQWDGSRKIQPHERKHIGDAIDRLAQPGASRTIDDFVSTVQDQGIRDTLAYYHDAGPASDLLNGSEDSLRVHRWSVFEMMHLMERGPKTVVPVLAYLFRCIERRLDGKRPTLIVLDEAWLSLSTPYFMQRFNAWLRLLRSYNAAVVFATQNLTEIMDSPIASLIISSTPTKILLPNKEIMNPKIKPLYEGMGLNEKQIHNLQKATAKRDYYLMSEEGRRMISLGLGRVALAFVGASGKEEVDAVRAVEARYGAGWPEFWMRMKGVPEDWIEYWKTLGGARSIYEQENEYEIA
uniref:VirB4 family type IV secretion/conjugal transfer ATPase n=1 Tax=Cupriavidus gilardii TaxID=82541 RepID=UPI00247AFBF7|nr:transporter [Cupriavidus gilardii]WDE72636.1 Conjugative transfer protein TrbE [Cupriavidus gilardii]